MSITEKFKRVDVEADLERKKKFVRKAEQEEYERKLKIAEILSLEECKLALDKFGIRNAFSEINNNRLKNTGRITLTSGVNEWYEENQAGWGFRTVKVCYKDAQSCIKLHFTNCDTGVALCLTANVGRDLREIDNPFGLSFSLKPEDNACYMRGRWRRGLSNSQNDFCSDKLPCVHKPDISINAISGDKHQCGNPNNQEKKELTTNEVKDLCQEKIVEVCRWAVLEGYL